MAPRKRLYIRKFCIIAFLALISTAIAVNYEALLAFFKADNIPQSSASLEATQQRPDHYIAGAIQSSPLALAALKKDATFIANILKGPQLSGADLEKIHEASYSLEAAVDYLRTTQNPTQEVALDALDEAVQAIHYGSENHKEQEVRQWFTSLEKSINEIQHVFN